MSTHGQTGSRIRERRLVVGLRQAELARQAGISASYLNLIEHNRRRIGGKLLLDLAEVLQVEPHLLSEGAEATLLLTLREAAEDAGLADAEAERSDEFAGRFPGWAKVLASTYQRLGAVENTVEALTDRLSHDPHLAASMHELLTIATSIRSTAAILAETETLEPAWRDRFHANIHSDSQRLSESAQTLVDYLEADPDAADPTSSAQDEVEAFLAAHDFSFPALEKSPAAADEAVSAIIADAAELRSKSARYVATAVLRQVAGDAARLPLARLRDAIDTEQPDPARIAARLALPLGCVLRRLAALPELKAGIVVCDRSGTVIFRKSVAGFTIPRHGACCPLWPLFAALGQPGLAVHARVGQLGQAQSQFECFATAENLSVAAYNSPPLTRATMLLLPAPAGVTPGMAVGASCRVCPHEDCAARREPSILRAGV